jgi:hypothetical protein
VLCVGAILVVLFVISRKSLRLEEGWKVDLLGIVQEFDKRVRQLQERLVEQDVALELQKLRLSRLEESIGRESTWREKERPVGVSADIREGSDLYRRREEVSVGKRFERRSRRSEGLKEMALGSQVEFLKAVAELGGVATSREVQLKLGKSREHTARMMSSLFMDGFVSRDDKSRPFKYALSSKGREMLADFVGKDD